MKGSLNTTNLTAKVLAEQIIFPQQDEPRINACVLIKKSGKYFYATKAIYEG